MPISPAVIHTNAQLLSEGADPKLRDRDGWSALHCASRYGRVGSAWLLLKFGAPLTALEAHGRTARDVAKRFKRFTLEAMLDDLEDLTVPKPLTSRFGSRAGSRSGSRSGSPAGSRSGTPPTSRPGSRGGSRPVTGRGVVPLAVALDDVFGDDPEAKEARHQLEYYVPKGHAMLQAPQARSDSSNTTTTTSGGGANILVLSGGEMLASDGLNGYLPTGTAPTGAREANGIGGTLGASPSSLASSSSSSSSSSSPIKGGAPAPAVAAAVAATVVPVEASAGGPLESEDPDVLRVLRTDAKDGPREAPLSGLTEGFAEAVALNKARLPDSPREARAGVRCTSLEELRRSHEPNVPILDTGGGGSGGNDDASVGSVGSGGSVMGSLGFAGGTGPAVFHDGASLDGVLSLSAGGDTARSADDSLSNGSLDGGADGHAARALAREVRAFRKVVQQVYPRLPPSLQTRLFSREFLVECSRLFDHLDTGRAGSLDMDQMTDAVAALLLDGDTAAQFDEEGNSTSGGSGGGGGGAGGGGHRLPAEVVVQSFDSDGDGAIDRSEFIPVMRHMVVAAFLARRGGQRHLGREELPVLLEALVAAAEAEDEERAAASAAAMKAAATAEAAAAAEDEAQVAKAAAAAAAALEEEDAFVEDANGPTALLVNLSSAPRRKGSLAPPSPLVRPRGSLTSSPSSPSSPLEGLRSRTSRPGGGLQASPGGRAASVRERSPSGGSRSRSRSPSPSAFSSSQVSAQPSAAPSRAHTPPRSQSQSPSRSPSRPSSRGGGTPKGPPARAALKRIDAAASSSAPATTAAAAAAEAFRSPAAVAARKAKEKPPTRFTGARAAVVDAACGLTDRRRMRSLRQLLASPGLGLQLDGAFDGVVAAMAMSAKEHAGPESQSASASVPASVPFRVAAGSLAAVLGELPEDPLLAKYIDVVYASSHGKLASKVALPGSSAAEREATAERSARAVERGRNLALCERLALRFADLPDHEAAGEAAGDASTVASVTFDAAAGGARTGASAARASAVPSTCLSRSAFGAFMRCAVAACLAVLDHKLARHDDILARASVAASFEGRPPSHAPWTPAAAAAAAVAATATKASPTAPLSAAPPPAASPSAASDGGRSREAVERQLHGLASRRRTPAEDLWRAQLHFAEAGSAGGDGPAGLQGVCGRIVRGSALRPSWAKEHLDSLGLPTELHALLRAPEFEAACDAKFALLDDDGNGVLTYEEVMGIGCFSFFLSLVPLLGPLLGAEPGKPPPCRPPSQGAGRSAEGGEEEEKAEVEEEKADEAAAAVGGMVGGAHGSALAMVVDPVDAADAEVLCRYAWRELGRPFHDEVPAAAFPGLVVAAASLVFHLNRPRAWAADRAVRRCAAEHAALAGALAALPLHLRGWLLSTAFVGFCEDKWVALGGPAAACRSGDGGGGVGGLGVGELRPLLRALAGVDFQAPEVRRFQRIFATDQASNALGRLEFGSFMTWAVVRTFTAHEAERATNEFSKRAVARAARSFRANAGHYAPAPCH